MIGPRVSNGVGTGEPQRYATALDGVWMGLSTALARLEAIAGEPDERLNDDALETLPVLQYALHRAAELAVGIDPPAGTEEAHAELADALGEARDVTGEIVDALEAGGPTVAVILVHEWRGALFRVRLARLRLAAKPAETPPETPEREGFSRAALAATALILGGAAAFLAGAVLAMWPLWAVGLVLVAGGFLVYRP